MISPSEGRLVTLRPFGQLGKITTCEVFVEKFLHFPPKKTIKFKVLKQGKLFHRCMHFFVLQCTVFGRKSKHKTGVTA